MMYLDFLERVHELATPASYLEIGVHEGESLALARSTAVGIDPAYDIQGELPPDASLYRGTSDDYFASGAIDVDLPGGRIDLAFIDGIHLFEYALRDFVNVEAHSGPRSVVVMDDMLPRSQAEAQRERTTADWTGDVWKMIPVLAAHRPDLEVVRIATQPTGLLLIMGLDSSSSELTKRYDEIVAEFRDVSEVPLDIIARAQAVAPDDLLAAPFWREVCSPVGEELPMSARVWTPTRTPDAAEIEASKESPWRDELLEPATSGLTRFRRRVRGRG